MKAVKAAIRRMIPARGGVCRTPELIAGLVHGAAGAGQPVHVVMKDADNQWPVGRHTGRVLEIFGDEIRIEEPMHPDASMVIRLSCIESAELAR